MNINHRAQDLLGRILLVVVVLGVVAFLVAPLLLTLLMSFDARTYLGPLPPPAFSLQWYERFLSDSYFLKGLQTSLIVASVTTVISASVGVLTALLLHRCAGREREALLSFFLSPLIVPPVVLGFGLLLLLSELGVVSGWTRLICGHLILTVPYSIRASALSVAAIPPTYTDAALNLGASPIDAFFSVTLPLARSGIVVGAIFSFVVSIDDVAVAMFLSTPDTYTLPYALLSSMRANFDLSIAAAASLFVLIVVVGVLLLERVAGISNVFGGSRGRQ